jgi:hypothetical protein
MFRRIEVHVRGGDEQGRLEKDPNVSVDELQTVIGSFPGLAPTAAVQMMQHIHCFVALYA